MKHIKGINKPLEVSTRYVPEDMTEYLTKEEIYTVIKYGLL